MTDKMNEQTEITPLDLAALRTALNTAPEIAELPPYRKKQDTLVGIAPPGEGGVMPPQEPGIALSQTFAPEDAAAPAAAAPLQELDTTSSPAPASQDFSKALAAGIPRGIAAEHLDKIPDPDSLDGIFDKMQKPAEPAAIAPNSLDRVFDDTTSNPGPVTPKATPRITTASTKGASEWAR